jgi:hypothetical protein
VTATPPTSAHLGGKQAAPDRDPREARRGRSPSNQRLVVKQRVGSRVPPRPANNRGIDGRPSVSGSTAGRVHHEAPLNDDRGRSTSSVGRPVAPAPRRPAAPRGERAQQHGGGRAAARRLKLVLDHLRGSQRHPDARRRFFDTTASRHGRRPADVPGRSGLRYARSLRPGRGMDRGKAYAPAAPTARAGIPELLSARLRIPDGTFDGESSSRAATVPGSGAHPATFAAHETSRKQSE